MLLQEWMKSGPCSTEICTGNAFFIMREPKIGSRTMELEPEPRKVKGTGNGSQGGMVPFVLIGALPISMLTTPRRNVQD